MKKVKNYVLLLLLVVVGLASCDKVDEVTDIKINNVKVTETIDVSVIDSLKSTNYPFAESVTISLADVPELQPYLNSIVSVNIDYFKVTITDIEEGVIAQFEITLNSTNTQLLYETSPVPVNTAIEPFSGDDLSSVATDILDNHPVAVSVAGTTTEAPVEFTVTVELMADFVVDTI